MLGWIKAALGVAMQLYSKFSGGKKVSVLDALPEVIGKLLPAVQNAIKYQGLDSKAKVDAWLLELDTYTGEDVGAIDLIPDMPAKVEEVFFDHLKEVARCYAYMCIGVDGYKVVETTG